MKRRESIGKILVASLALPTVVKALDDNPEVESIQINFDSGGNYDGRIIQSEPRYVGVRFDRKDGTSSYFMTDGSFYET